MSEASVGVPEAGALAGTHILVTRPAAQAAPLCRAIRAAGGIPVVFPLIEIRDVTDRGPLEDAAAHLDAYDFAVFVSPNAVERALAAIRAVRPWPAALRAVTVGTSSERALAQAGIEGVIAPRERFDSEALLECPELAPEQVRGRAVVIFRGDGGRELLGDELIRRGARVDYVPCYRRAVPQGDGAALTAAWREGRLDAITLTSSEGLRNLWALLDAEGRELLAGSPVFVPHARIAEGARALGLRQVALTGPADAGLLAGLVQYFAGQRHAPAS